MFHVFFSQWLSMLWVCSKCHGYVMLFSNVKTLLIILIEIFCLLWSLEPFLLIHTELSAESVRTSSLMTNKFWFYLGNMLIPGYQWVNVGAANALLGIRQGLQHIWKLQGRCAANFVPQNWGGPHCPSLSRWWWWCWWGGWGGARKRERRIRMRMMRMIQIRMIQMI